MKTAMIIGATSDVAIALTKLLSKKGYNIFLAARNVSRLEPLKSDIEIKTDNSVELIEHDSNNHNGNKSLFQDLKNSPEVIVYFIGYLGDQGAAESSQEEALKIMNSNYTNAVLTLNEAATYCIENKKGIIVGVSSVAGERGRMSNYLYGSAKAGFSTYLDGLRNRLFHEGLHVITVKPGFMYTKMTENLNLPGLLTATPDNAAKVIYKGIVKKKNTLYVKGLWRLIMFIIRNIPEMIFKRLKM